MMEPKIDDKIQILIADYLSGQMRDEDARALKSWVMADESNRRYLADICKVWDAASPVCRSSSFKTRGRFYKERKCLATALAAVVTACMFIAFWSSGSEVYNVKPGGKPRTVRLSDGSTVKLNVGSTLTVPRKFGRKERSLTLDGEAIFNVVHNEEMPLTVSLAGSESKVKVTGTVFNLKSYSEDDNMEVALKEGKVLFFPEYAKRAVVLDTNEQVVFSRVMKCIAIESLVPDLAMSWQNDCLVFRNTTLRDILNEVSRKFDIPLSIRMSDISELNRKYSAQFAPSQSLTEIMDSIASLAGLEYAVNDNLMITN